MSLSTTFEQLKKTLARAERAYAEGRDRHPALAPYDSPSALLAAVDRGSRLGPEERDQVFVALLAELRCSPSVVWQTILLLAFAPMLVKMRARLRRPGCQDMDQRVLSAFLEAARSLGAEKFVPRLLFLGVRTRLYSEGRREHRARDLVLFDDDTFAPDLFGADAHAKAVAAEALALIEAAGGSELREALLARHSGRASMKEFVDHAYADLRKRERARVCDRLYRTELAVFRKLRKRTKQRERVAALALQ